MSNKKGKQLDVLGEAHLPADLLTPTLGDNYGLDGYPDMEYGMGVLEGTLDEDSEPSLPDGIVMANEDLGLDLGDMVKEGNIADLSWLELNEQDPDRLPKDTASGTAIPELEEAWGANRRVQNVVGDDPQMDLEHVRFQESLDGKTAKPSRRVSRKVLAHVVRKAMRRSAQGHDLKDILTSAATALGDEAHRVRSAMEVLRDEHGLAGNVFIRASAYPGYEQGKFGREIKRFSQARYILVDEKTLKGATHIENGRCQVTGKQAVTAIPWKKALQHYRPLLEATGRKVAGGSPREALRAAFFASPERLARPAHHLPRHVAPSQRITREAALLKFHSAPAPIRAQYDPQEGILAQRRAAAWRKIERWSKAGLVPLDVAMGIVGPEITGEEMLKRVAALVVKTKGATAFSGMPNDARPPVINHEAALKALQGVETPAPIDTSQRPRQAAKRQALVTLARWVKAHMLSKKDAQRLARSGAEPLDILKAASSLVASGNIQAQQQGYSGVANDVRVKAEVTRKDIWATLKQVEKQAQTAQTKVDKVAQDREDSASRAARHVLDVKKKVAIVKKAIDQGVRGDALKDVILRTIPRGDVKIAARFLEPILRKTGALDPSVAGTRSYDGVAFRPVAQKVASTVSPREREITKMLRWAAQSMNEGFAGAELDQLLQTRFGKGVRNAGAQALKELRADHEGGSGFMYVDAAAYSSTAGTKGCGKGALKHRANGIKYVLAMDRCKTCSLVNALPDGSRVCQEYNKTIVTAAELPDESPIMRRANIKASNADDSTSVASMFAPMFDEGEFDLHNASMSDIELDSDAEVEELGNVLFGGMEWTP